MVFPFLLRHLQACSRDGKAASRGGKRSSQRRQQQARPALHVECLEARTVPSTLIVTSAADDGSAGTLRAVLASAQNGDTIEFAHKLAGKTIALVQGQLNAAQNVDIVGLGANKLTISGNAASRIFDIASNAVVKITGLTITLGLATDGAAILNAGKLSVSDDVFSANVAQGLASGGLFGDEGGRGGAIENQTGATLSVLDSTFANNQAVGGPDSGIALGGGIYNEAGTLSVSNSTFTGNLALAAALGQGNTPAMLPGNFPVTLADVAGGGAIWNDGGILSIANSTLLNNEANGLSVGYYSALNGSALGGAVGSGAFFASSTPGLKISDSTLSGNLALASASNVSIFGYPFYFPAGIARGGAVEAFAGNVTVYGSTLSDNLAESGTTAEQGAKSFGRGNGAAGGAIDDELNLSAFGAPFPSTSLSLDIENSRLSDNVAQSNAPVTGSVLLPAADGGAVAAARVNTHLTNSTLTGNQAIGSPGTNNSYYISGGYTANGGYATGGGVDGFEGSLTISGSALKNNLAEGGSGAAQLAGYGPAAGLGGYANGGGISSNYQNLTLNSSIVSGNQSIGGSDTGGGFRQALTGSSYGGGLYMGSEAPSYGGSATIEGTLFANNVARGGATFSGGEFGFPNSYGAGLGGGACSILSAPQINGCAFVGNLAQGGAGEGPFVGGPAAAGGLYCYASASSFAISYTNFIGNQALGGAGNNSAQFSGVAGGNSWGGALVSQTEFGAQASTVSYCDFIQNTSQGGAGGGGLPGAGGDSAGGAVMVFDTGSIDFTHCNFRSNQALGGAGGSGASGNAGANGGAATGGALVNESDYLSSTAALNGCTFVANSAQGGMGGTGAAGTNGGAGGNAQGGAVYNLLVHTFGPSASISLSISNSVIAGNTAAGGNGGAPGAGGVGGSGGDGAGGGFFDSLNGSSGLVFLTINTCIVAGNQAEGGDGTIGGDGGNGYGGGLFIDAGATGTVQHSLVTRNEAEGGDAQAPGTPGQGIGGGVYNLGIFDLDAYSLIIGNLASTSNNNVFGPVTAI